MSLKKKFITALIPLLVYLGGCFVYLYTGVFVDKIEWLFWVLTVLTVIGGIIFFTLTIVEAVLALSNYYSHVISDSDDTESHSFLKYAIASIMYLAFFLVTVIAFLIATGVPN